MRQTDHEVQLVARDLGAVADAVDLELAGVASGHALDHVGDEGPQKTVAGGLLPAIALALDDYLARFKPRSQRRGDRSLELALGTLDDNLRVANRDIDPCRQGNRFL